MIRFRSAFFGIALVLVFHAIGLSLDLYHMISWYDVPMHFFGGFVMALLGLACFGWISERVDIRPKTMKTHASWILEVIFVVGFVMIIGVAWEWYEYIFDQFATTIVQKFGVSQMGLGDTMDDLFNDFIGAITAWILWRKR